MSTLDEPLPDLDEVASSLAGLADALGRQRERARAALGDQRRRFGKFEQDLLAELTQEQEEVQSDRAELDKRERVVSDAEDRQAAESQRLTRLAAELESREQAVADERAEVAKQQDLLARDLDQWRLHQSQADSDRESQRAEMARREQEVTAREKELEELELDTKNQRRKIARDLRTQRAQQMEELEQLRAEIESKRSDSHGVEDDLRQRLAGRDSEFEQTARDLMAARSQAASSAAEIAAAEAKAAASAAEAAKLRKEADQLRTELEKLEEEFANLPPAGEAAPSKEQTEELSDLRRRLEMAVEDLRELKTQNGDLRDQLATAKRSAAKSGGAAPAAFGESLSWEAQKKKLLAELEDYDGGTAEEKSAKLSIEGTIQITDGIVAEKEREIQELQRLLGEQSQNVGAMAIGAAAIAEVLDTDSLIREERENLKKMQEEWREKLRQGEVEVALERAKLARQRLEMEEKLSQVEAERKKMAEIQKAGKKAGGEPSITSSWLAKLGLFSTPEDQQPQQ